NLSIKEIDLVITGENGDIANDRTYTMLHNGVLSGPRFATFKHLCGEYPTATSFAVWLAVHILQQGKTPGQPEAAAPRRVLIYNHYQHIHHSIYLLSAC
ncbi:MAG: beta-ketoacyl synthase chain length factor, partial [Agriterribacter sp.]